LNPQVNKIQSHSFKRYPNSLGDQRHGSPQHCLASGVPINAYDLTLMTSVNAYDFYDFSANAFRRIGTVTERAKTTARRCT
jgi:hypothetical protein